MFAAQSKESIHKEMMAAKTMERMVEIFGLEAEYSEKKAEQSDNELSEDDDN